MLDSILEGKYRDLEKNVKRYVKYVRLENWLLNSVLVAFFVWLFIIIVGYTPFLWVTSSLERFISIVLLLTYVIIVSLAAYLARTKALVYQPDADDMMLYYSCSILKSLEGYDKSKRSALKEEYRKKAVKSAKEILSTVKEDWTLGDFRLAKKVFGETISALLDNLSNRVIPSLEKDGKTLKKVESPLYQFAQYLLHPTVEGLQNVNKSMSEHLKSYETEKLGFFGRCSSFFATHAILKHSTIVVLILIVSFVPALLGLHFWHISTDSAFLGFAAIFAPLIGAYFLYVLRRE